MPFIPDSRPTIRKLYWVMYSESVCYSDGSTSVRPHQQHFGTEDFDTAREALTRFRDFASRGVHYDSRITERGGCINSAWLEVERREVLEV